MVLKKEEKLNKLLECDEGNASMKEIEKNMAFPQKQFVNGVHSTT